MQHRPREALRRLGLRIKQLPLLALIDLQHRQHYLVSENVDLLVSADQIDVLELPPDSLSSFDLHDYVQALRESGQNADRYALALWRKLSTPLTTGAMIFQAAREDPYAVGKQGRRHRIAGNTLIGFALVFQGTLLRGIDTECG